MLHIIPKLGYSHLANTECECGPQQAWDSRRRRFVIRHPVVRHPLTTPLREGAYP